MTEYIRTHALLPQEEIDRIIQSCPSGTDSRWELDSSYSSFSTGIWPKNHHSSKTNQIAKCWNNNKPVG
jgi:hypothetical protein